MNVSLNLKFDLEGKLGFVTYNERDYREFCTDNKARVFVVACVGFEIESTILTKVYCVFSSCKARRVRGDCLEH